MGLKDKLRAIFDSYSRRPQPPHPQYKPAEISQETRARILMLYTHDFLSNQTGFSRFDATDFWRQTHQSLRYLLGRSYISGNTNVPYNEDLAQFLNHCDTGQFFDFIEITFKQESSNSVLRPVAEKVDAINEVLRVGDEPYQLTHMVEIAEEVPRTFDEQGHSVPHNLDGGPPFFGGFTTVRIAEYPKIVRVDEEITHSEAVVPALLALQASRFEAANGEFRAAMADYRNGNYDDCLRNCGNTFESVMKVLCKRNRWPYQETDTAGPLLKLIIANSSLDQFFEQPLMLIGTMRNRLSTAHGAGNVARKVDRPIAQYAITATAGAIVLLVHGCDK